MGAAERGSGKRGAVDRAVLSSISAGSTASLEWPGLGLAYYRSQSAMRRVCVPRAAETRSATVRDLRGVQGRARRLTAAHKARTSGNVLRPPSVHATVCDSRLPP